LSHCWLAAAPQVSQSRYTKFVLALLQQHSVKSGRGQRYFINERMSHSMRDLSDDQWEVLDTFIPKPKRRVDGRGRPWKSRRSVLNGNVVGNYDFKAQIQQVFENPKAAVEVTQAYLDLCPPIQAQTVVL